MDVNEVLEDARPVSKEQFLLAYYNHHSNRPKDQPEDQFSLKVYRIHDDASNVKYWQGMVKDVAGRLVLPHHFSERRFIQPYGEPLLMLLKLIPGMQLAKVAAMIKFRG